MRLLSLFFVLVCGSAFGQATGSQTVILTDARVIVGSGRPPFAHASVVLENGKITRVVVGSKPPALPNARIVPLTGKTLLPGLIAAHSHLGLTDGPRTGPDVYTEQNILNQLQQFERYGVTTVMSLGLNRNLLYDVRNHQRQGTAPGASILTADRGIGVPGGYPPAAVGPDQLYRPGSAAEARAAVKEMASRRPDMIKIWVDTGEGKYPKMKPDIEQAVIDETHRQNLKVAAHVFYLEDARRLVEEGVDVLAHSIRDQLVNNGFVARMKLKGVYYVPTLQLEESFFGYADQPPWMQTSFFQQAAGGPLMTMLSSADYRTKTMNDQATARHRQYLITAKRNLKLLAEAGVRIGFGTDSGANPMRIPGFAEQRELALLTEAGLTPLKALQCATATNARLLGIEDDTGTIAAGRRADLLIVDGNPAAAIQNLTRIASVWHHGAEVVPLARGPVEGIGWK